MCIVDSVEPAEIIAGLDPDLDPRHRADMNQLVVMRAAACLLPLGQILG